VGSRQSGSAKRPPRGSKVKYEQRVTALLAHRDELIEGIHVCARARGPSPFLAKADALLTRFWARADWNERAEILRAARWLLDMGSGQAAVATSAEARNAGRRRVDASAERPPRQAAAPMVGGTAGRP
jgi:hypothetical protein